MTAVCRGSAIAWLFVLSSVASAQLPYNRTAFVPGLGESSDWWRRQNTVGRLWQQVNLVDTLLVSPSTLESIATQTTEVLASVGPLAGKNVFVGHSMGGVVIREAARLDPGRTHALLSVGSPHRGAIVADNATVLFDYTSSVIDAMADGVAGVLGLVAGPVASVFINSVMSGAVRPLVQSHAPSNSPARQDLRTYAAPVWATYNYVDNVPHAAVYGRIDRRFAWMKVASSAAFGNTSGVPAWEAKYQQAQALFRKCTYLKWTIILSGNARKCGRAHNAMSTYDVNWQKFTAGGNVPSDGWITNASSLYPRTDASNPVNLRVDGVDHGSLITLQNGIDAMAFQMKQVLFMPAP